MSNLLGNDLWASPELAQLVNSLVDNVQSQANKIEGVRPPSADAEQASNALIEQIGKVRGRPLFYPYVGTGLGSGPYVELMDGSVKLDLINGIGIHILGHSHPKVMAATVRGALSDSTVQGNLQPNLEYAELGRRLVEIAGRKSRLAHAWISTSGSMANENALKMVRQKNTPARKIIALEAAFAGRTTMMAEVTDNPSFKVGLPEYHEVLRVPFASSYSLEGCATECVSGCRMNAESEKALQVLKQHVNENKGDISAFMFEPMQGEGGYKVACRQFLLPLLDYCKQEGIAIWADEVQTFSRTGEFFAFETLDIGEYIDVCTVAKTLQTAATLYTEEYNPKPGLIAGTFAGSSAALAAGIEILNTLENDGYLGPNGKIINLHNEFIAMLNRLNETTCKGQLQEAGGLGLMAAVTPFDGSKEKMLALLKVLYKNGMMAFGCGRGPFRLRFLLPAVMTTKDVNVAGEILEKSINEML